MAAASLNSQQLLRVPSINFSNAFTRDRPVCIVGLGLIGGSVAKDLKLAGYKIVGIDSDSATRSEAKAAYIGESMVFDAVYASIDVLRSDIQTFIIATPGDVAVELVQNIANICECNTEAHFVIDLASTKTKVVRAMQSLPAHVGAIGGHPMAGKTDHGFAASETNLFYDKTFVLCPVRDAADPNYSSCIAAGEKLINAIGSKGLIMAADEHDRCAAYISHLPHVIAYALADLVLKDAHPNAVRMAASGFEGASRLSGSESNMVVDMAIGNKDNILQAIDEYVEAIIALRELVENENKSTLFAYLDSRKSDRNNFLRQRTIDSPATDSPKTSQRIDDVHMSGENNVKG